MLLAFMGCYFQSCKDCEPTPSSNNTLQVSFYRYDSLLAFGTKVALSSTFDEVSALTTTTVFFDATNTQTAFALPLSNVAETTSFTFLDSIGNIDTLQVSYFKKAIINGPDCGIYEEYRDLVLDKHTFDSGIVVKNVK